MTQQNRDEPSEIRRRLGPLISLGTMFAASLLAGIGAGYWADGRLGTRPWLTVCGMFAGLALGFYNFFSVVLRAPRE